MPQDKPSSLLNRRDLLSMAPAAAVLAGSSLTAAQAIHPPSTGTTAPAPGQAAHLHEPLENFKYDLEAAEARVSPGGSAREVTVDEFPISKSIAGVSMRLKPGGLRELHWHAIAGEWAYVIKGNVRTTVLAPTGEAEQNDFGPGDVWFFPKGHPHALQGLGPEETHFVLIFDDGYFSEFGTFSITDWFALTAPEVLSRNTGLDRQTIAGLPRTELYIPQGKVPPRQQEALRNGNPILSQRTHKYQLAQARVHSWPGGEERIVDSHDFPISNTITGVILTLQPGGLRELHWHPNADEWQYYISGRARVGIFGAHGRSKTEEFAPGQVGFIKQGFGHYIEQVGPEPTRVLITFNAPEYQEISLSTWLSNNPAQLIADNFGLSLEQVARMPKSRLAIAGPAMNKQ